MRPHGTPAELERRRLRARELLEQGLQPYEVGPEAWGFSTALWTCRRIAELIHERFHVVYHPDHIGRLLRSCGFTPQRPPTRAKERDDPRIRVWIQQEWARAKKNSPASGPA